MATLPMTSANNELLVLMDRNDGSLSLDPMADVHNNLGKFIIVIDIS